jgi:hypothetical protein
MYTQTLFHYFYFSAAQNLRSDIVDILDAQNEYEFQRIEIKANIHDFI